MNSFYQKKRNYFVKLLKNTKFKVIPSKGTYFQLVDYSDISDEKDKDFAIRLIKDYGVASIPLSSFYHDTTDLKVLRFCFAKSDETLEQGVERLLKIE